jgi:hypothetical protein
MPYTLRKYDGTILATLEDGVVDTASSSIYLIGKDTTNYGTTQNDNFLWLVEHFAGTIEPQNKVQGQIWFDKGSLQPKIYDGFEWRNITLGSAGASQATNAKLGELRFDTTSEQLFAKGLVSEVLIGPEKVQGFGTTRLVSVKIFDTNSVGHACIVMYSDAEVIGVISNDEFDVKSTEAIYTAGIVRVGKGITFRPGYGLTIDVDYAVKALDEEVTGAWTFSNTAGVTIGSTTISESLGNLVINKSGADIVLNGSTVRPAGSSTALGSATNKFTKVFASEINAGSSIADINLVGQYSVNASSQIFPANDNSVLFGKSNARWASVFTTGLNAGGITANGIITGNWALGAGSTLDVSAGTFESSDAAVGSLATRFITSGGTEITGQIEGDWSLTSGSKLRATYADIAEKYSSDKQYEPGTVVMFGGSAEVTISTISQTPKVAGVVTTNPAQILNDGLENSVAIALVGRVPCKVVGKIEKGDLLTASNVHGVATVSAFPRAGSLVGKALEDYNSHEIGTIEVMVLRG